MENTENESIVYTAAIFNIQDVFFFSQIKSSSGENVVECIGGSDKGINFNDTAMFNKKLSEQLRSTGFDSRYLSEYIEKIKDYSAIERQLVFVFLKQTNLVATSFVRIHDQIKLGVNQYFFKINTMDYVLLDSAFRLKSEHELGYIEKITLINDKVINPFFSIRLDEVFSFDFVKFFQNNHRKAFISFLYEYRKDWYKKNIFYFLGKNKSSSFPFSVKKFKKQFKKQFKKIKLIK